MSAETESERLFTSAAKFARSALGARLDGDESVFVLHAGTSLEHLLKAHLSGVHPALIRRVPEKKSFEVLLHAIGHGRRVSPLENMHSIDISSAMERSGRLMPDLANLSGDLHVLVEIRNGLVHVAELHPQQIEKVLIPFMKACQLLIDRMARQPEEFWDEFTEMVRTRLATSARAAEIRAADAITAAQRNFAQRYGHLEAASLEQHLSSLEARYRTSGDDEQLNDCPACSRLAFLSGSTEVEWSYDYDEDSFGGPEPEVTFYPGHLLCDVCSLELDGEDELQAAGVEVSWILDDVDIDSLIREYYEDEYA